jgi:hypothetical protein
LTASTVLVMVDAQGISQGITMIMGCYIVLVDHVAPGVYRAQITGHGRHNDFIGTGRTPGIAVGRAWRTFSAWRRTHVKEFQSYRIRYRLDAITGNGEAHWR